MRKIIGVAVMTLVSTLSVYAASLSTAQAQSTLDVTRTAGTFSAKGTQILLSPPMDAILY
jgi:hypothetical protein